MYIKYIVFLLSIVTLAEIANAGEIPSITSDIQTEFGAWHSYPMKVTPSAAPYQVPDEFIDSLGFSGIEKVLLNKNGFLVVPPSYKLSDDGQRGKFQRYATIPEMYKGYREQGIPVFVTTDAVLHSFHELYDYSLKELETKQLAPNLNNLCRALDTESQNMFASAAKDSVKEAIRKNIAYFSVAAKLGDPLFTPPEEVSGLVEDELSLIDKHEGFDISPIFRFPEGAVFPDLDYLEDYSQYVPRGHYADNDTLSAYFLSSMWLGRMAFRIAPHGGGEGVFQEKGIEETFMAFIVVKTVLQSTVNGLPALTSWHNIYDPSIFFIGSSDDLTIEEYIDTIAKIYGSDWLNLSPDDLYNREKILSFIEEAKKLRNPLINSSWVYDNENPGVVTKSFRFLGQRFIPDSYMFQQLVYDHVGTYPNMRLMPKSLDLLSVLGSERAFEHLTTLYHEDNYSNYINQMNALRKEFSELSPETWVQNLYWSWIYSLIPLLEEKGPGYPPFMQNSAWTDKQLVTASGSWTELRHDSILYAKQSYTEIGIGEEPFPPTPWLRQGYVEPNPELYGRLASLAGLMREGLSVRNILPDSISTRLPVLEHLLLELKAISEKELTNIPLTSGEYETINNIGLTLESIQPPAPIKDTPFSPYNRNMALVADVHTDPNYSKVLEEGIGHASEILVIVKVAGRLKLARGAVFTTYEFVTPMSDRLTDSVWRDLLDSGQAPALPEWVENYRNREALSVNKGMDIKEPVNGGLLAPKVTVNTNTPAYCGRVEIHFSAETSLTEPPDVIVTTADGVPFTAKMDTVFSGGSGYQYILETAGLIKGKTQVTIEASYMSGWKVDGTKFLSTLKYDIPLWVQGNPDDVEENLPVSFSLFPNYPNPFNPSTSITYSIPKSGHISLNVYSISGQKVATLVNGFVESGKHEITFDGSGLASGVYLYRFEAQGFSKTGKMLLMK